MILIDIRNEFITWRCGLTFLTFPFGQIFEHHLPIFQSEYYWSWMSTSMSSCTRPLGGIESLLSLLRSQRGYGLVHTDGLLHLDETEPSPPGSYRKRSQVTSRYAFKESEKGSEKCPRGRSSLGTYSSLVSSGLSWMAGQGSCRLECVLTSIRNSYIK